MKVLSFIVYAVIFLIIAANKKKQQGRKSGNITIKRVGPRPQRKPVPGKSAPRPSDDKIWQQQVYGKKAIQTDTLPETKHEPVRLSEPPKSKSKWAAMTPPEQLVHVPPPVVIEPEPEKAAAVMEQTGFHDEHLVWAKDTSYKQETDDFEDAVGDFSLDDLQWAVVVSEILAPPGGKSEL